MRAKIEEQSKQNEIEVRSAGIAAFAGSPASIETRQILLEHEINFEGFRSTQVSKYLLDESDYIFCLSRMHREAIISKHPEYREKALLVGEFLGDDDAKDVSDPFGLGDAAYKVVEQQLLSAIDNILAFVQENSSLSDTLES